MEFYSGGWTVKPLIFAGIALILPKTFSQKCYELDLTGRDPSQGMGLGAFSPSQGCSSSGH